MVAFDQTRLLHWKKDPICTLLILKRIKFAKRRRKRICWIRKIKSSRYQILLNIGVLENFANFTGEYLCWSLFFSKVAGLQLYYKTLQHRCFPVKFVKFLRTPFFTEHLRWLLLENLFRSSRERRLHITGEIYAVVWQMLLFLLVVDVSSCIWRTLMFGCFSYFCKGDQTETVHIIKSTFALLCYNLLLEITL